MPPYCFASILRFRPPEITAFVRFYGEEFPRCASGSISAIFSRVGSASVVLCDGGGEKLVHFVGVNGTTDVVRLWNSRGKCMPAIQSEALLSLGRALIL